MHLRKAKFEDRYSYKQATKIIFMQFLLFQTNNLSYSVVQTNWYFGNDGHVRYESLACKKKDSREKNK